MNILKKTLSLTLALALLTGLLIPVSAAQITIGQEYAVTIVDDETPVVFEFVPGKTGYYGFYSYNAGKYDPYGYIMDADRNLLVSGDDTDNGTDFYITCHMTAGKTYYLAATTYSGSAEYCVQIETLLSPTSMAFETEAYTGDVRGMLYPQVRFFPEGCVQEGITLSSSDDRVAQVVDGDLQLGIPGTATVTATSESGLTATCTVTVNAPQALSLNAPLTLEVSTRERYLQFVAPADGWYGIYSAGEEIDPVVEVLDRELDGITSHEGSLPGDQFFAPFYLAKGQLCYFAISTYYDAGSMQVTVQNLAPAVSVTVPWEQITGYADTVCQLEAVFGPEYSIPEALTWHSSNEDVVYVDDTGYASYLQPGHATVTVTSETGKTDSVAVTVLAGPTDNTLIAWGNCGPSLQWQLSSTGVLTITGSGEMYDLYDNSCHWDAYSNHITQVIFPEGITHIGYGAFLLCKNLQEITIPDSVRTIGSSAFSGCSSLIKVILSNQLERIGIQVFEDCTALEEIRLPDSLTRIPYCAFSGCTALTRVTLPGSLKTLGFSAFAHTGLTQIDLPKGLQELRDYALANSRLQELTVPATVKKLGCSFVTGNPLTDLHFLGSAPHFDEYALASVNITAHYPDGFPGWTEDILQNYGGTVIWVPEITPGVTLSGMAANGILLTLTPENGAPQTLTAENENYLFTGLLPGVYTLTATAVNHVPRTYTLTVAAEDLTQDIKLHLIGDLDGNGSVNMGDISIQYAHIKGTKAITDPYSLLCADINGGGLNMGDLSSLYAHIKGTKKLY